MIKNKSITIFTCIVFSLVFLGCDNKKQNTDKAKETSIPIANVAILPHACDPMDLTVESGKTKFIIHNKSGKNVEWEILKGIRIIDERENIVPGFKREITVFLDPGEYEMTCGLLSNPKGKLTVKLAKGASKFRKPTSVEFAGALGEYKVYTMMQTDDLLKEVTNMQTAIQGGDLQNARVTYTNALSYYEKIESFLKQFSSLDQAISASSSLFEKGENDEKFKGLHRIEVGLFKDNSTENLNKYADELVANVSTLLSEVKKVKTSDRDLLKYCLSLISYAHDTKLKGLQNSYAKSDISSLNANIDGSYRIFRLVKSMLEIANPDLLKQTDKQYKDILAIVDTYKDGNNFKTYENLSDEDKQKLGKLLEDLQKNLAKLPNALGIN